MTAEEIKRNMDETRAQVRHSEFAFARKPERRRAEPDSGRIGLRNEFARDADRILYSHAFARYMDKTQVFIMVKQDHISKRALHVQMVSRIARTIGRALGLDEDLIEATALGHDIGHPPFGHLGEHALSDLLMEHGCGCFTHNAQSVRVLQRLEARGRGLNLTLPVLDGILSHNGEIELPTYRPCPENLNWETMEGNTKRCLSEPGYDAKVFPATLEGCVVRVSDMISYVGKDVEDALALRIIRRSELPDNVKKTLGDNNSDIVGALCRDIILNSYGKDHLAFSREIFSAFRELKQFNMERIYRCEMMLVQKEKFQRSLRALFELYLDDLGRDNRRSSIFVSFLDNLDAEYSKSTPPGRIVADFISGMTDQFFLKLFERQFMPISYDYDETETIHEIKRELPAVDSIWESRNW